MMKTLVQTDPLEDFLNLPDGPPYYELINGQLKLMASPRAKHQEIVTIIVSSLYLFCKVHRLGKVFTAPLDVFLDRENVYQPDLLFIAQDRWADLLGEDDKIHGAPDWVAEILSPSNLKNDTFNKRHVYFRSGVKEYWIIDPEDQTVEVMIRAEKGFQTYCLVEKEGKITSQLFSEWQMTAEELFA